MLSPEAATSPPRIATGTWPWQFPDWRRLVTADRAWFTGATIFYLGVASVLVFVRHQIVGDALSRVGSATYMLFSRDPHLGAVGFVWNPLPTLLIVPIVPLATFWPPLVSDGFAACLVSALAMAGAVVLMRRTLMDWSVVAWAAGLLTLLFAIHPMTVQYGANGDSEALFILALLLVVRSLARWLADYRLASLVGVAAGVALAYTIRYEAAFVALVVAGLVLGVSLARTRGTLRSRAATGLADAIVVATPFAIVFIGWAMASWIVVGSPFEQFSSEYGTSAQLVAGGIAADTDRSTVLIGQLAGLEPFAAALLVLGLVWAIRVRSVGILAAIVVFGSVLVFAGTAWMLGRTGGWLRYEISIVPLAVLAAGGLLARRPLSPGIGASGVPTWVERLGSIGRSAAFAICTAAAVASLMAAIPSALTTMSDPVVGREDHYFGFEQPRFAVAQRIAADLDARSLPDGAVLVDTFLGYPIVLDSDRPRQFVVTSDRDFQSIVADPAAFEIRYILVPQGGGLAALDAIQRRWPGLYETGSGIAVLVSDFSSADTDGFNWRLYQVTPGP